MEKGIYQPIMSDIDTRAAYHTSRGVEPTSMAGPFGMLLNLGKSAYSKYNKEKFQEDLEQNALDPFFEREANTPENIEKKGQEAFAEKAAIDAMWSDDRTGVDQMDFINEREKGFRNKLAVYKAAAAQGRMSTSEFQTRVTTVLRDHINKNPWMKQEYINFAKEYLNLSGAEQYIDERDKLLAAQQKENDDKLKILMNDASQNNIDIRDPNWGTQLAIVYQSNKAFSDWKQNHEMTKGNKEMKDKAAEDLVLNPAALGTVTSGAIINFNTKLQAIKDNPELSDTQKLQMIDLAVAESASSFQASFGKHGGVGPVKDTMKRMEDISKTYKGMVDGSIRKDVAENELKFQVATKQLPYAPVMATLPMLRDLPPDVGSALIHTSKGELHKIGEQLIKDAARGLPTDKMNLGDNKTADVFSKLSEGAFKALSAAPTEENKTKLNQIVRTGIRELSIAIQQPQITTESTIAMDASIKALAENEGNRFTYALDPETRRTGIQVLSDYLDKLMKDKLPAGIDPTQPNTTIKAFPDGTLIFESSNKQLEEDLNRKVGTRLNNAMKAMATVSGLDAKTMSKAVIEKVNEARLQEELSPVGEAKYPPTKIDVNGGSAPEVTVPSLEELDEIETFLDTMPEGAAKASLSKEYNRIKEGVLKQYADEYNKAKKAEKEGVITKQQRMDRASELQQNMKDNVPPTILDYTRKSGEEARKKQQQQIETKKKLEKGELVRVEKGADKLKGTKDKWYVYSETKDNIRFWSPTAKKYIEIKASEVAEAEKLFGKKRSEWLKWGKK